MTWNCPCLDTEWLLSTLFDASLLSTFKAAGFPAALFFGPKRFRAKWLPVRVKKTRQNKSLTLIESRGKTRGNHIRACRWTPGPARAMICSS
jgi:hypothetical protein